MTDKQEMKEKDERKERPEMIPRTMSNNDLLVWWNR
jgi:hypothetical protein